MEETIEKCAVPFCEGTTQSAKVRIQFPIHYTTQQMWWRALGVQHNEYTTSAALCTKHFDLEEDLAPADWEYYLKHQESGQAVRLRVEPNIVPFRHVSRQYPPKPNVKHCMVKTCGNNSVNSPNKRFILLPKDKDRRDKWIRTTECTHHRYCCEDHFNLETDMENYMHYKIMGSRMKFKKGVVPHIFKPKPIEFADCGRIEKGSNTPNNCQDPVLQPQIVKSECVLPNLDYGITRRADADSCLTNVELSPDESESSPKTASVVKNEVLSDNDRYECSNEFVNGPICDVKNEIFFDEIKYEDVDDRSTFNRGQFEKTKDKSKAMSAIKAQLKINPKITIHPIVGKLKLPPPAGSSLVDNLFAKRFEQLSNRSHDESLSSKKVKNNASSGAAALSAVKAELVKRNPNVIIHPVVGPCKVALVLPSAGSSADVHENSKEKSETLHRTVDVEKTFNFSKNCTALSAVKAQLVKRNPKVIIHPVIGPCKVALVLP